MQAMLSEYGSSKVEDLLSCDRLRQDFGEADHLALVARTARKRRRAEGIDDSHPSSNAFWASAAMRSCRSTGFDDLLVYRAKCCNPIRGEEVIGYITRGKGVAVHSKNCPNVQNLMYEADRKIEVEWAGNGAFCGSLCRAADDRDRRPSGHAGGDRRGDLRSRSNILNVEARTADERGTIDITVEIPDMKHLERVIASVKKIDGVYDVSRSTRVVSPAR